MLIEIDPCHSGSAPAAAEWQWWPARKTGEGGSGEDQGDHGAEGQAWQGDTRA